MNDEITARLAQFIEAKGLSIRAFERALDCEGVISRAIRNGTAFSHQYLGKIALVYPELDMEWLIRGKGVPPVPNTWEEISPQKEITQLKSQMKQIQETLHRLEMQGFTV